MQPAQTIPAAWIVAFARAAAFAATAPMAGGRSVPPSVRAVLAIALVPAVVQSGQQVSAENDPLLLVCAHESFIGAAFGVAASIVAAAAGAAGSAIDAALSMRPTGREPMLGGADGPFSRLYALAMGWLFMASGAMTHLCARFTSASAAIPVGIHAETALALVRSSFDSAFSLASPAIAGQLIATIVAAAAARAAPRINGLFLASPLSTGIVLLTAALGAATLIARLAALARAAAMTPAL